MKYLDLDVAVAVQTPDGDASLQVTLVNHTSVQLNNTEKVLLTSTCFTLPTSPSLLASKTLVL